MYFGRGWWFGREEESQPLLSSSESEGSHDLEAEVEQQEATWTSVNALPAMPPARDRAAMRKVSSCSGQLSLLDPSARLYTWRERGGARRDIFGVVTRRRSKATHWSSGSARSSFCQWRCQWSRMPGFAPSFPSRRLAGAGSFEISFTPAAPSGSAA